MIVWLTRDSVVGRPDSRPNAYRPRNGSPLLNMNDSRRAELRLRWLEEGRNLE